MSDKESFRGPSYWAAFSMIIEADYLKLVLFDLLYFRRSSGKQTAWFRNQKHNKDLVPAVELKVGDIIDLFEKYHKVTYDTQGIRDRGIDVLLRYQAGLGDPGEEDATEEAKMRYIGFQIKSFDDLNQKGWLTKLKAQILDARNLADLQDLYILLCTDLVEQREQLRTLNAELVRQEDVHIVRPEFVHNFLHLPIQRIAAYLKTKLSSEDRVFKKAVDSFQDYSITQSAIVIELSVSYFLEGKNNFEFEELHDSSFVVRAYENYPSLPSEFYEGYISQEEVKNHLSDGDPFYDDLEILNSQAFSIDSHNDRIDIFLNNLLPIGALILDGRVRYGYDGDTLREYLLSALLEDRIRKTEEYLTWRENVESGILSPST